jgi:hypothetical protein
VKLGLSLTEQKLCVVFDCLAVFGMRLACYDELVGCLRFRGIAMFALAGAGKGWVYKAAEYLKKRTSLWQRWWLA